jgi:nucleoside-diphosphate-sugar epimerase
MMKTEPRPRDPRVVSNPPAPLPGGPLVDHTDLIVVTGSNGFIGTRVVEALLLQGFTRLRCFVRPSSNLTNLERVLARSAGVGVEVVSGNLLSPDDCRTVTEGARLIYHLAAGRGEKSYPSAYLNSVVATRNLLEAVRNSPSLKRVVCVSSFTVYSTRKLKPGAIVAETCEIEDQPHRRGEAYCYAKVRQDELVHEYARTYGIPYVIARPGVVYGPGNPGIPGRVGLSNFGIFLHLGGRNRLPLSYVTNCAEAIVLAGITPGVEGHVFNIVDDDLPTSRAFLRQYKRYVRPFRSIYLPHSVSYLLCYLWETYAQRSGGQLPPVFNRRKHAAYWKGHRYSNEKIKALLGWKPSVPSTEALSRYFESERHLRSSR